MSSCDLGRRRAQWTSRGFSVALPRTLISRSALPRLSSSWVCVKVTWHTNQSPTSLGAVPWRWSSKCRVPLATSGNWIFNFALGDSVPPAFVNIRWKIYLVVAALCVDVTFHVFIFFPEAAYEPLEEIIKTSGGPRYQASLPAGMEDEELLYDDSEDKAWLYEKGDRRRVESKERHGRSTTREGRLLSTAHDDLTLYVLAPEMYGNSILIVSLKVRFNVINLKAKS